MGVNGEGGLENHMSYQMAQKAAVAKSTKIKRTTLPSPVGLDRYCPNLDAWPRSWLGWETAGERLVASFRPFLEHLISSDLSPKAIQKHADNLWVLGGAIIRELNETPSLRKVPTERLLCDFIEDGAPLFYQGDPEGRSFASTSRKLQRYLTRSARGRRFPDGV